MNQEGGSENQGSQGSKEEKKTNAAVQLLIFVIAFLAILTFLFYAMGLYSVK